MRIELYTVAATADRRNEDYVAAGAPADGSGGAAVLLDGVTPPADGDTGCAHDVPWFTSRLGGSLLELAAGTREDPLADCLARAVAATAAAHGPRCLLSHPRTPQATVVALRWDAERLEFLVLSDSVLLLCRADGTVRPVLDQRLDRMRERADLLALRTEIDTAPEGSARWRAAVRTQRRITDELRNGDGGFFTAAADPSVAARAVTGFVPRRELDAVVALSDGASRWAELFGLGDWTELAGLVRREGGHTLVGQVRAAEAAPGRIVFPGGKPHDDASVVCLDFATPGG